MGAALAGMDRRTPLGAILLTLLLASACSTTAATKKPIVDPSAQERQAAARKALAALQDATRSEDPEARAYAAVTWGSLGNPAARNILTRLLDDFDLSVRSAAAVALWALKDDSGVAVLRAIIKRRPAADRGNPLLATKASLTNHGRAKAVRALAEIQGGAAASVLELLRSDPSPEVREAAALALAKVGGSEEAFKSFIPLLRSESEGERMRAVAALAEMPDARAEGLLKDATLDKSIVVRQKALKALGDRGELLGLPELETGLTAREPEVREAAAEALGRIRSAAAAAILERLFEKDTDARERLFLWRGLARLGRTADLAPAEAGLRFVDPEARVAALDGLEGVGTLEALRLAAASLEDPAMTVRVRAAAAVIRLAKGGKGAR